MKRIKMIFSAFLLFLFINGCRNALIGDAVRNADIYENGIRIEAYFCPEDDCRKVLMDFASNSERSLHCAFFDISLDDLINAIAKKSYTADVKVAVYNENYDGQIKGPGVKLVKSRRYMHNKFCVADGNRILTGSTNPTNNDASLNNNNIVIIHSGYIAKNYEDEFNEIWGGTYSSGDKVKYNKISTDIGVIETYFCPDDCSINSNGGIYRIIELARNARESVKIASFSFTHEGLADELIKADIRGINVSVLMESKQRNVQNSQYKRLKDFGISIRVDGNKYNMHNKFVVIDGSIVVTGSPNHSSGGNDVNDENMLVIHNKKLASMFIKEFNDMFDDGSAV